MTVLPEKSTRLPDKFPRKRPCFPLRRWQKPRMGFPNPGWLRPGTSALTYMPTCNCKNSHCSMMIESEVPFCNEARRCPLYSTISDSLLVISSSVLAFSCATDGRIQIGGAGMYCQMNISGLPSVGSSPSSSQSVGLIALNRLRTFNGFKSSIAFRACFSRSPMLFLACAKEASNSSLLSGATFFCAVDLLKAENLSWTSFITLSFRMVPWTEPQCGHVFAFRHCSLIFFTKVVRRRLSMPGFRSSFKYWRR